MKPGNNFLLPALLILFMVFHIQMSYGIDDIDDLFEDPPRDIITEDTQEPEIDLREQLETGDKVLLKGHFSAIGAAAAGWKDYPDLSDPGEGFGLTPGARAVTKLSFDARPSTVLTIAGTVYSEIDPGDGENTWTAPGIEELYADYNWIDKVYFRAGKYKITWGQGRLFTPGNLMANSSDGAVFRAVIPALLDGVSFVSLADPAYEDSAGRLGSGDLVFAGLADKVFGGVRLSAGTRYQKEEGFRGLGTFKTVLWKTDILSDFVIHYNDNNIDNSWKTDFEALVGFFREWDDLKLYGEYYYDNRTSGGNDHNIGLAMGHKDIFDSPFDAGIEWKHSFYDNSGRVMPGIAWKPWKHIKAGFAVPFQYGDVYARNLVDDDEEEITNNRSLSFLFTLELSSSF